MERLKFNRYVRRAAAGMLLILAGCSTDSSLSYPVCEPGHTGLPAVTTDESSPVYDRLTDPDWIVDTYNFDTLQALTGMDGPIDATRGLISIQDVACLDVKGGAVLSPQGLAISQELNS